MKKVRVNSGCAILGFKYTHMIKIYNRPIPSNVIWKKGFYYVAHPAFDRHIGHFSEGISPLLLKLRFPEKLPPITDFYIPRFKNNEFEWSRTCLKLLIGLFPKNQVPTLHLGNEIPRKKLTCFRSAVRFYIYCNTKGFSRSIWL